VVCRTDITKYVNHREGSGLFLSPSYFPYGQTVPPSKTVAGIEKMHKWYTIDQMWTNKGCHVARSPGQINFCTVAANICGSSVWNVLMSSFWRLEFWDGSYIFRKYVVHWYRLFNSFRASATRLWKAFCRIWQVSYIRKPKHSLL
jgi:hypothetical protein